MKKKFLLSALMLAALSRLHGQTNANPATSFTISLASNAIITSVDPSGVPHFSISGINSLVSQYGISNFKQVYPASRFKTQQLVYEFTCNSTAAGDALKNAYPTYFASPHIESQVVTTADYYPNDMPQPEVWPIRTKYLSYINAPTAWGINKGNPNVVIGIVDTHVNENHEDLSGKLVQVAGNNYNVDLNHGTQVCGYAAAATDNGKGYPAIGFNSTIDFVGGIGALPAAESMKALQEMSLINGRKILNASWQLGLETTALQLDNNISNEVTLQEIYENGSIVFFGAGNSSNHDMYEYPSSLDYAFSVSDVGWDNSYSSSATGTENVEGLHEHTRGDVSTTYHHNTRVDLLAPGYLVGGLSYQPNNGYSWNLSGGGGTSYSSPMVAGTAALILSENPCYSPYQIEYILKQSANHDILNLADNQPFAGKLGFGALDAGRALKMSDPSNTSYPGIVKLSCNDAATQTFSIDGIKISSLCSPGAGTGSHPKLTPVLENGIPPYTYRWEYYNTAFINNEVTLSSQSAAEPEIATASGANVSLRLTVYDNSPIQKVASKILQMKLYTDPNKYDLAMRDSYMDMLDEANSMMTKDPRDWNIWQSPDIWNRKDYADGIEEHQDPEYNGAHPNYLYVKVHNVGCAASPAGASVRLYWTKSSTGENWPSAWDGSTQVAGSVAPLVPGGGQIIAPGTTGPAITLPSLAPGTEDNYHADWYVQDPELYAGSPKTMEACVLARIETQTYAPYGMTIPELSGVIKTNVWNNNNIITKNLVINNLVAGKQVIRSVDFANAGDDRAFFDLELINDRAINLHFSGDFSSVGYATLHLGDLYDRWREGGALGNYASIDDEAKTVTFDGSTTLRLNNILLNPQERFPVGVEFTQRAGAVTSDFNYTFHLRQFDSQTPDDVYGNVTFKVATTSNTRPDGLGKRIQQQQITDASTATIFNVYPNPADDRLNIINLTDAKPVCNITVCDILGRTLITKEKVNISWEPQPVDISKLSPGVYTVTIITDDGTHNQMKFIKK